jgi:hypothetical protein
MTVISATHNVCPSDSLVREHKDSDQPSDSKAFGQPWMCRLDRKSELACCEKSLPIAADACLPLLFMTTSIS